MAVLSKPQSSGAHWYTREGAPRHKMSRADGTGERNTTIKDARWLELLPSVTSILSVFGKPALNKWKQKQAVMSAMRNVKSADETDDYYIKRVIDDAFSQVSDAAELGSRIHAALDNAVAGLDYDSSLTVYVGPVIDWIQEKGLCITEREKVVVNLEHGFAGISDVFFSYGKNGIGILDYKSKKTVPNKKVIAYTEQALQIAAYAATHYGVDRINDVLAANVFVSTTEPGRMEVVKHTDLGKHWEAFKLAASLWRYQKVYDPRGGRATPATERMGQDLVRESAARFDEAPDGEFTGPGAPLEPAPVPPPESQVPESFHRGLADIEEGRTSSMAPLDQPTLTVHEPAEPEPPPPAELPVDTSVGKAIESVGLTFNEANAYLRAQGLILEARTAYDASLNVRTRIKTNPSKFAEAVRAWQDANAAGDGE